MKPEEINVAKKYELRFEYQQWDHKWVPCVSAEYCSLAAAKTDAASFSNSSRHRNVEIYEIHRAYTLVERKGKWVETKGAGE